MLVTHQQSAELAKPCISSLHNPATNITPQFASIFVAPLPVVLPVGRNQFDAALLEPLPQWVRIVAAVGNHAFGLLSQTAFRAGDPDFGQRGFRKRNFTGGSTFQANSQRKTLTVDQYHPLRALATLGFTDGGAPFLAGAKLPSRKVSSHWSRPSSSNAPSRVRHASSQMPSSSHRCSRRQQVESEGNSSGKKRHAAPVCKIHKMGYLFDSSSPNMLWYCVWKTTPEA